MQFSEDIDQPATLPITEDNTHHCPHDQKSKKNNHREVIDSLKAGVYGAHDFLSCHIIALLCLTGTADDLDLLAYASISELTTTARKLED